MAEQTLQQSVEERIAPVIKALDEAQRALVAAQKAMVTANRLSALIPLYIEMSKLIVKFGDWQKEIRRFPW